MPALLGAVLVALLAGCNSAGVQHDSVAFSMKDSPAPAGAGEIAKRDIVTTGSIEIVASDPAQAANAASLITTGTGGHVDSRSEHIEGRTGKPFDELVLRIPSDKLDPALGEIKKLGSVVRFSIKNDDVTAKRVDLDARIAALQTSVDRLLGIMRESKTAADLLSAETTLSQRQSELDGLRAQRAQLGDQISLATIDVSISATPPPSAPREYQGFFGSVRHGWDALKSFGSVLGLTIGFLLPWLSGPVLIGAAVYLLRRRSRAGAQEPEESAPPTAP
ncbi:MAG: DUF4349 domain-containing protein [Segniliparus sp.]